MRKKRVLLIVFAFVIVAVGIVAAAVSQKQKEMNPQELLQCFEKAAEEGNERAKLALDVVYFLFIPAF